ATKAAPVRCPLPRVAPAIAEAPLEDHLHTAHSFQPALEIIEQLNIRTADHDEELDVGERQGRKRREEQRRVPRAVAARSAGLVEGPLPPQLPPPPLGTARRADDFHPVRPFAPRRDWDDRL